MPPKSPRRDPNAPKRNQSAYLLYQNAMRNTFKGQNPGMEFGQLSKYTSAMYAELTPEEKEVWVRRAEADKQRYLAQLTYYKPAQGYDAKGDAIAGFEKTKRDRGIEKDPNAPKRNLSAYLMFQNAMRDTYKAEFPAMTFGQLSKHTSEQYKNLSEEEMKAWKDKAAEEKERYDRELAAYSPPEGYDNYGVLIESKTLGTRKYTKKEWDADAPKRPRGSYCMFTGVARPQILKDFPGIKFTDMGHVMGERWRALSPDEKKKYEDLALEDKKRFDAEMEEYKVLKAAKMAAISPPKADYGYNQAASPEGQMYAAQPGAEQYAQFYQHQYGANTDVAAAFHQQYAQQYYAEQGYSQEHH